MTAFLLGQSDIHFLDRIIHWIARQFPGWMIFSEDFYVRGFLAVVLASLVCGAVGSLVVGNRMAFFSDALAHCAFAGIALGLLMALLIGVAKDQFWQYVTPIMIGFGMLIGMSIAFVREKTGLASDTVIGVFFAGGIGLAAMLVQVIKDRAFFTLEDFLFGNPITVMAEDLVLLLVLALITAGVLAWMYNHLVFTSFNPSLARSRRISVQLCSYLFIVLLALIVNVCLKTVGVLLVNALLIVPAATVGNVARNMRQLFWGTVLLCLGVSCFGFWLSSVEFPHPNNPSNSIQFGTGGTMVVACVLLFYLSLFVAPAQRWWQRRRQELAVTQGNTKV